MGEIIICRVAILTGVRDYGRNGGGGDGSEDAESLREGSEETENLSGDDESGASPVVRRTTVSIAGRSSHHHQLRRSFVAPLSTSPVVRRTTRVGDSGDTKWNTEIGDVLEKKEKESDAPNSIPTLAPKSALNSGAAVQESDDSLATDSDHLSLEFLTFTSRQELPFGFNTNFDSDNIKKKKTIRIKRWEDVD
nr:probable methyltransferase PMT19 isoform X1 [Ipomoea trifida]